MQEEMKVWLLLDSSKPGGIESHVMQLASGLRSHGVAVSVVFLAHHGKHPMKDALDKEGIDQKVLGGGFYSLVKALHIAKPALVHTHGYKAGILARAAGLIVGIPVALSGSAIFLDRFINYWFVLIAGLVYFLFTRGRD